MSSSWLDQLAPAHAPAAPGWWPPAPGWWGLAVFAVVLSAMLISWLRSPRRALRRSALRQLRRIQASEADGTAVARAVQNLLRRYALQVFGHEATASLTGEPWLEFVVSQGGTPLAGSPGRSLLTAAYGNHDQDDRREWLQAAERFIKRAGRKP
jgi:Domain of unknown function (DUF4381)